MKQRITIYAFKKTARTVTVPLCLKPLIFEETTRPEIINRFEKQKSECADHLSAQTIKMKTRKSAA
jgi:hypothetical protein